jgi:3'-phosphoadenosine 5'-phosphosulfate (PAPS) 3'-phosphatase
MAFAAERKVALQAVRLACRVTERVREAEVIALAKSDASPVTAADFSAQVESGFGVVAIFDTMCRWW